MGHNPMMGNLTYLHVAMRSAIHAALELFVWHEDDYYDDGDVLGTNTWKYMGMLSHYSHLGIWSILTITQLLSMLGIMGEINIMAWMYAEMLEMIIGMVYKLGMMYTYDALRSPRRAPQLDVRLGHGSARGGPGEVHGTRTRKEEGARRRDDGVCSEDHRLLHYLSGLLLRF